MTTLKEEMDLAEMYHGKEKIRKIEEANAIRAKAAAAAYAVAMKSMEKFEDAPPIDRVSFMAGFFWGELYGKHQCGVDEFKED